MKDPSDAIRQWVFDTLDGNITYGGSAVTVYSFPPKDETMPYILLAEQSTTEAESTKDAYLTESEITIEVWSSHSGNDATYKAVNTISDDILQLIRTRTQTGFDSDYNVITVTLTSGATQKFLIDNKIEIVKSLIIKLLLEEL